MQAVFQWTPPQPMRLPQHRGVGAECRQAVRGSIGLLGVCIYFSYFFSFIFHRKICFETKMLFICWVMMMGSAAVFDTDRYFLCTVLILCTSMNSRKNISPNNKLAICSNNKLQMDNTQREALYL